MVTEGNELDALREMIQKQLVNENSGHDYAHVMRVFQNAVLIAQYESDVRINVVKAAALLHDIAYGKRFYKKDHSVESARIAKQKLSRKQFTKEEIDKILETIEQHNIWVKVDPSASIETKIVRDADRLDHLGYTGIIRAIAYATLAKARYIDTIYLFLSLKGSFETNMGKKLSRSKVKVMKNFVKKLEAVY